MAGNGATPEEKEKLDLEAGFGENEMDDSKAKFINGGKSLEDTAVVEVSSAGDVSFTGLGKEELKKYAEDPFWVRLRWILFILFWVGWLAMLVSAIVIIVLAPRCPSRPDLKWYHTDSAYNVYSKSFFDGAKDKDGNQDGYGDLAGVMDKQGYIEGLGAKTIWLSSIFKTDGTDGGIIDHKQLDEKFGTVDTFRAFLKKMLKKGVRVIVDLIPNQTSKNHTWFQNSRENKSGFEDYYVWTTKTNNWKNAGVSRWKKDDTRNMFYLHDSADHPELNLRSKAVLKEFKEIMEYWAGVGVSGFHIVGVEYLTENASLVNDDNEMSQTRNFPDNAGVIDYLRGVVDGMDNKPGREKVLLATVGSTDPETLKMYYGKDDMRGVHMVSVVLDQLDKSDTAEGIKTMLEPFNNISTQHWMGWRGDDCSCPPSVPAWHSQPYYGDEIGMVDGGMPGDKMVPHHQCSGARTTTLASPRQFRGFAVNSYFLDVNVDSLTAQLRTDKMVDSFKEMFQLRMKESDAVWQDHGLHCRRNAPHLTPG
ncbi:hypothetical protein BaRGS_00038109 [Batillaria attramentaria]|uniref:Glycosyl hydrolase family 13 catalytic domain-containing protein n=1 Tax=Batillaria attramentaria TaxID=370345 RepID=A0ABD0J7I9_9CAEN